MASTTPDTDFDDLFPDLDEKGDLKEETHSQQGGTADAKVELDLDDAPFLHNEDEEEEEEGTEEELPDAEEDEVEAEPDSPVGLSWEKVKWMLAGAALCALVVALLLTLFGLGREQTSPEFISAPDGQSAIQETVVAFDPFLVEKHDGDQIRFLRCSISLVIPNKDVDSEIQAKRILLRDAVYQYLDARELVYLEKQHLAHTLKKDLQATMNQYLERGKVQKLYIEEYVVY